MVSDTKPQKSVSQVAKVLTEKNNFEANGGNAANPSARLKVKLPNNSDLTDFSSHNSGRVMSKSGSDNNPSLKLHKKENLDPNQVAVAR